MANKFVRKTGSDGAAGTSAGASWATLGKALGASGMADGDTLWVGGGIYREVATIGFTPTVTTQILADLDGAQTGDAGDVIWTAYNGANQPDVSAPANNACLDLAGKSFLLFDGIHFIGGNGAQASCIDAFTTSGAHDITFQRCPMFDCNGVMVVRLKPNANVASNWTLDRCLLVQFNGSQDAFRLAEVDPNVAGDLDQNILIKNSTLICFGGGSAVRIDAPATLGNTGKPGGFRVRNCVLDGSSTWFQGGTTANMSTTIPNELYNSIAFGGTVLTGGTVGALVEDYNRLIGSTARSNVTAGKSSVSGANHSPLFEMGQSYFSGRQPRPFLSPMAGSPLLGFGGTTVFTGYTQDMLSRPRPSGGAIASTQASDSGTATGTQTGTTLQDTSKTWGVNAFAGYRVKLTGGTGSGQQRYVISNTSNTLTVDSAWGTTPVAASTTYSVANPGDQTGIGCFDRHDIAIKETTTVDVTPAISKQGPYDHDILIPVDAVPTTISIKVQRDANYGAGTKPQITLLPNGEIGVVAQTVTDAGAASQWNTLTLSAFTPTAKGVIKLRLDASGSTGIGKTSWDTLAVS